MNEIDDNYKQETEDLDNEFIENHNLGKTKNSTINKYLSGVSKSRNKFVKDYAKYNRKERWKIMHPKKKKKKRDKQKYLKIKHFDFNHNSFEKLKMKLDILFFNIGRFFSKTFAKITPRILIYAFYKIAKTMRAAFRDAGYFMDRKKARLISNVKRWFKNMLENIKKSIAKIKERASKILSKFKKEEKKKDRDEDNGKEDEKNDKEEKNKS